MGSKIQFSVENENYSEDEAEEIFDYIHHLISDIDSSATLLTGGSSSVEQELIGDNVDEKIIEKVRETEEILHQINTDDVEELSEMIADFLKDEKSNRKEIKNRIRELETVWRDGLENYKENVLEKVENPNENNVKYASQYMETVVFRAEELSYHF